MARDKSIIGNIDNSNPGDYPNARIKDNTGAGNGTPVNELLYGDIHEFFAKLMRLAGLSYNGLPDNETNRYQLIEALIHLASKNDKLITVSLSGDRLAVPLKLSKLENEETFIGFCSVGFNPLSPPTEIVGNLGDNTVKTINVTGNFVTGEYVRIINKENSVDIIRLVDFNNIETVVANLLFLKKASQAQEDAGISETVATTPLSNKTVFAKRVNGDQSDNYLATLTQNGLMSFGEKAKLANVPNVKNYGTASGNLVDVGVVGTNAVVSGQISSCTKTAATAAGSKYRVTMSNAMDNMSYQVSIDIESLGDIGFDSDLLPVLFKKINTTSFEILVEESAPSTHNIKLHFTVTQR